MEPTQLEQSINRLTDQLNRLSSHLLNDDQAGRVGTIEKVQIHDQEIEKLKTEQKIRKASNAVWGSIGGGLILLARELILVVKHA